MSEERKSFIFYQDFDSIFQMLSMEQRGQLITAILDYERNGRESEELGDVVGIAFCCIKRTLDRDEKEYLKKCKQNAENGKKGGRPRKNFLLPKTERFFEEPKKADNDNGNGNENENDNDSDNGNGSGGPPISPAVAFSDSDRFSTQAPPPSAPPTTAPRERTAGEKEPCLPLPDGRQAAIQKPVAVVPLSAMEKEELIREGIPEFYLSRRMERACAYGARNGKSGAVVLREWWQSDRRNYQKGGSFPVSKAPVVGFSISEKSYDSEDFWQAALERSRRSL